MANEINSEIESRHAPRIAAIILAAGRSSRMGMSKGLLDVAGVPFLARLIRSFRAAGCDPVHVVTGHAPDLLESAALAEFALPVRNDRHAEGQLTSLAAGILSLPAASSPHIIEGILMTPVDHPIFDPEPIRAFLALALASGLPFAVPTHAGRRGHPLYVHRSLFAEFLATGADSTTSRETGNAAQSRTARDIVRRDPARLLEITIDNPAFFTNLNEPAGLGRLEDFLPD